MTDKEIQERPRAVKSAARRQHLLDTARNLFIERGFHQTGMAQIAAASGIAVGQIYRDFANKEAIITAICETEITSWLDEQRLSDAVAAQDNAAIMGWIEQISFDEPCADERRLMCELLAELGHNPAIRQMHAKVDQRLRTSLEAALGALAPGAGAARRSTVMDFIVTISWGTVALQELSPQSDCSALQTRLVALLRQEVANLKN